MISLKRIAELERLVEKYESTLHGHSIDAYKEARRVLVNALYEALPDLLEVARENEELRAKIDTLVDCVNDHALHWKSPVVFEQRIAEAIQAERAKYRALEEAARQFVEGWNTVGSLQWRDLITALDALNGGGG